MVSQEIGYSSLCYTVGPCCLLYSKYSSLHLPTPNSQSILLSPLTLGNHKSDLYVCEAVSVL